MPPENNTCIGFALGGNIGDRRAYLAAAAQALKIVFDLREVRVSPVYESEALLPEGGEDGWNLPYLNAVLTGEIRRPPKPPEVLRRVKMLERALGRRHRGHWGPREIDIDLLFMGDAVLRGVELTLPHLAMAERAFVMVPLADIAPGWVHPLLGKSARELAEVLPKEGLRRCESSA